MVQDMLETVSELASLVISPGKNLSFGCQKRSKCIATRNLSNWDAEINFERERVYVFGEVELLLSDLVD